MRHFVDNVSQFSDLFSHLRLDVLSKEFLRNGYDALSFVELYLKPVNVFECLLLKGCNIRYAYLSQSSDEKRNNGACWI